MPDTRRHRPRYKARIMCIRSGSSSHLDPLRFYFYQPVINLKVPLMRKFIASALLMSFVACSAAPALAREENPFITSREINLIELLAPPPTNESEKTRFELA